MKNTTKKQATKKATTKKAAPKKQAIKQEVPKQEVKKPRVRKGTTQHKILKMLTRKNGATLQQLHEATGWKLTTLRGTPGALKIKLGVEIESQKRDGKDTIYRITSDINELFE